MSKRFHITRALLAVILLSAFLAAFLVNRYQYFHVGAAILSRELSNRTGCEVTIQKLGGTVFTDIEMQAVSILFPDGLKVFARSLRLEYSIFNLLRPPHTLHVVTIESPTVVLSPPSEDSEPGDGFEMMHAPPDIPAFVDSLNIHGGAVNREGDLIGQFSLAASLVPAGDGFLLEVRNLEMDYTGNDIFLPVALAGNVEWSEGPALSLGLTGSAGKTNFLYTGSHSVGAGMPGSGTLALEPLAILELIDLFDIAAAVETAEARLLIRYEGRLDSCDLVVSGAARVDRFQAESLNLDTRYAGGSLVVDRLEGVVNGADFSGDGSFDLTEGEKNSVRLRFEGVDVGRFAPDVAGGRKSNISGELRWKGSGTELTSLTGDLTFTLQPSHFGDINIRQASIYGSAFPGGLTIDRSEIRTSRSNLQFGGVARLDGSLEGKLTGEVPSLGEFRALTPFDTLGGAVSLSVTVSGTVDSLFAEGAALIDSSSVEGVSCALMELDGSLRFIRGVLSAEGEAVAREIRRGSDSVDSLRVEVALDGDTLHLEDLSAWREEWYFMARGAAVAVDTSRSLDLRDVRLLRGEEIIAEPDHVRLWKSGAISGIDPLSFPFGNGSVRAAATKGPDDAVDVTLSVQGCDLSLLSDRAGVGPEFLRNIDLDATVTGTTSDPSGEVRLYVSGAEGDTLPFRDVAVAAHFRDSHVIIDSATISGHAPSALLAINGSIPIPLESREGDFRVDIDMKDYPIRELHFLTDHLLDFEGRADLSIRAGGSWDDPQFTASFEVDSTLWYGFPMGTVRADSIYYRGDSLIATLRLDESWGAGNRLFWRLPAKLSLGERDFDFLDTGPFRSRLYVPDGDFGLAFAFTDLLEDASGRFLLDVELSGDRSHPDMAGQFELRDGFLLPAQIAAYFEDVEARILIDEDYLTIVNCVARSEGRGRLDVWGNIDLDGLEPAGYDLSARAKRYKILLADGIEGLIETAFDGDLKIDTNKEYIDELVPHITGEVSLRDLLIEMEFREPEVGVQSIFDPTTEPAWTLDMQVNAPKKIIARNSVLDVELGGEARLTRSANGFGGVGEFEIFRGTYWVLNNQFRDVKGELILGDPDDLRNVDLDVTARTEILGERIEVGVTGKPDSLIVTSNSESGMTEGEIMAMLTFRARPEETVQSGELLSSWITSFANRFSRDMTRSIGDVGTIEIGTSDDLPEIRYGNYFSSDLFLGFSQKLGSPLDTPSREQGAYRENLPVPERQVRVEYRLRRSLVVQGEAGTFDDGSRFVNLDLKIKLPY